MSNPAPRVHTETITALDGQRFSFRMIEVLGGDFMMGADDKAANYDEKPIHQVNAPTFWMGEFPVTQVLWQAVLGENPSYFPGLDRPVEQVSWNDVTKRFLPALNVHCGKNYRLPSEAEWEYAARGGIHHSLYGYAGSNRLKDVGWYAENSHGETKAVGLKQPNALGLFDMSANVWEWCADHWHDNYKGATKDGSAWIEMGEEGRSRVLRGGSWYLYNPIYYRVSYRGSKDPGLDSDSVGFRLVLSSLQ
ncbi:formylglycine-generating enzyme family protein [Haliscomenobacter hydrossis]|uniref:Sulphatase-modifying factor protein n=1 Tax=Haliscomenobacter hydrossis (strain ATCC 27775 / DSM 1100 / LMG 10767 / O) TaxID=760192 RepID=F4L043_HALH1|nr:formylglycine-generating enzyme family protein [Haliscomenobacter hydrossis]AEE52752.1 Sulphatase-modifying factor protein [Haliscomenobacter hydrossis DSM 1100]